MKQGISSLKKINKIDKSLATLIKKEKKKDPNKSQMRDEKQQPTPQKHNQNIMKNGTPINWTAWKKWINSQKHKKYQA